MASASTFWLGCKLIREIYSFRVKSTILPLFFHLSQTDSSMAFLARVTAWLLCVAVGSCTFPRTQTMVELHADRLVETQANELRIEVRDAQDAVVGQLTLNPQATTFSGFPITIPVAARNGDDRRRFELRATAVTNRRQPDGSMVVSTIAQNRVRTSFRRGEVLRLTLWLLSGCRCDVETERCEPDSDQDLVPECVPIDATVTAHDAGLDGASDGAALCSANQHICDGRCVSLASPLFCGATCEACAAFPGATAQCSNGVCETVCHNATPDRCPSACVDLATERLHCGACGDACRGNQLCQNRMCVEPPPCSAANDTCPGLSYCDAVTTRCVPGCNRAGQCSGERMCNLSTHACECRSDLRACGDVCAVCPSGSPITATGCNGNACIVTSCTSGYTPSNSSCVDVDECAASNGGCAANAACTNTSGGRTCTCNNGYTGDGITCSLSCTPSCVGRACGNDGCGGSCGGCNAGICNPNGQCAALPFLGAGVSLTQPSRAERFGKSVSLSADGNTLAVGDPRNNGGAVTIFARVGGVWNSGFSPVPPSSIAVYAFGKSVSLSADGNTLAVGLSSDNGYGFAVVYTRNGDAWDGPVVLTRPQGARSFGHSLSLSSDGNVLAIGDFNAGSGYFGMVTAFVRSAGAWSDASFPTRPTNFEGFGQSVSISADGNTLAVGSVGYSTFGPVALYARAGNAWSDAELLPRPPATQLFGSSVALSSEGNTLAVGAPGGAGNATVYARHANVWDNGGLLTTPAGADSFGTSVSISSDGNTLAVGDPGGGGGNYGAVRVYTRSGEAWNVGTSLLVPSGVQHFGRSVSVSSDGNTLAVGSSVDWGESSNNHGAVTVYTR